MKKQSQKEKVEQAFHTIRTQVVELVRNPEKLEEMMREYGDNYTYNHYSPFNTLILMFETSLRKGTMFQMARGYKQWEKEYNRKVKKGEKAMWILAPRKIKVTETDEETGEEVIKYIMSGFRPVPVFELSQTEGEPIPRQESIIKYKSEKDLKLNDFLDKLKETDVKVEFEELLQAEGYTNGKKIVLANNNEDTANLCVLFHELAHYHLHYNKNGERDIYHNDSTNLKELEAETVSYMVSSALGIENMSSLAYISHWNKENDSVDDEFEARADKLLSEALSQIDLFMSCVEQD